MVVRESLSKARHTYLTFAPLPYMQGDRGLPQAPDCAGGEADAGERPRESGTGSGDRFLRTMNVSGAVRAAFRSLDMKDRPYVLRVYFETRLGVAEGQGKVVHRFVVHWGGHKGDITARYSLNKNRLPGDLIEEMREAYRRCEPILTGDAPSEGDVRREVARVLLGSLGYSEKELEAVDLTNLEQVRALTQKRVSPPAKKQALVTVEELPGYLDAGWTFVGNVGQDRVLLNPPAVAGEPTSPPLLPGSPAGDGPAPPR